MSEPQGARRTTGMPLFAFAVGGLLIGHAIAYLVAVPDPYHRDLVLQRTGHGYLPTVAELALVAVLAAAASVIGRAFRRGDGAGSFASIAGQLAALQVVAFAGQEVTERLVARVPLGELIHDHVLVIGFAMQVLVALVGALVLRLLVRAGERVAAVVRPRRVLPRPSLGARLVAITSLVPRGGRVPAFAIRGPPPA